MARGEIGFTVLSRLCNAVWHCVAPFPNHATTPAIFRARFVRRIIVRDDVIGLFRKLLICRFSVRFRAGSPSRILVDSTTCGHQKGTTANGNRNRGGGQQGIEPAVSGSVILVP